MKTRLPAFFFTAFLILVACAPFLTSGSWRYRMTVEVETPEGIKTGSAVREVHVTESPDLTPEMTASVKVKGEAVVVDLGERGVLFALLRGNHGPDSAYQVVYQAFPYPGAHTPEGIRHYRNLEGEKAELPPENWPMFVAFKDMNDPISVQYVYGMESFDERYETKRGTMARRTSWRVKEDNVEKLFGKGVRIKRVTIEMTNDKVTAGIEKWLPSFGKESGFSEWKKSLPYGHPLNIDRSDFERDF